VRQPSLGTNFAFKSEIEGQVYGSIERRRQALSRLNTSTQKGLKHSALGMNVENEEYWKELCDQAIVEQDAHKLATLVSFSRFCRESAFNMRICGTKSACLLLFFCVSGCKTAPYRPANVPASAVRIDGVFIDGSIEKSSRENRCAVYKEESGEIQVLGLFALSGAGREAKETDLRYAAFDGTRIWLQDARSLHPVLLQEYAVPGMVTQLVAFAGGDALNCGRVARNQTSGGRLTVPAEPFPTGRRSMSVTTRRRGTRAIRLDSPEISGEIFISLNTRMKAGYLNLLRKVCASQTTIASDSDLARRLFCSKCTIES
jgi:hypothetical protein